jgi:hypothetical protein
LEKLNFHNFNCSLSATSHIRTRRHFHFIKYLREFILELYFNSHSLHSFASLHKPTFALRICTEITSHHWHNSRSPIKCLYLLFLLLSVKMWLLHKMKQKNNKNWKTSSDRKSESGIVKRNQNTILCCVRRSAWKSCSRCKMGDFVTLHSKKGRNAPQHDKKSLLITWNCASAKIKSTLSLQLTSNVELIAIITAENRKMIYTKHIYCFLLTHSLGSITTLRVIKKKLFFNRSTIIKRGK